jgi:hypothetical protein
LNSSPRRSVVIMTRYFWSFLCKLDMKPHIHKHFFLYHVIVRPPATKIMNRADKNWAHFLKIKYVV